MTGAGFRDFPPKCERCPKLPANARGESAASSRNAGHHLVGADKLSSSLAAAQPSLSHNTCLFSPNLARTDCPLP